MPCIKMMANNNNNNNNNNNRLYINYQLLCTDYYYSFIKY